MVDFIKRTEERDVIVACPVCPLCLTRSEMFITAEEYNRIVAGEKIQSIFPDFLPEERELLISGTHPACWDEMMEGEED